MPNRTDADQAYEDLYQALLGALPADTQHLVHNLDGVVRERLAEAEVRAAALIARAAARAMAR